MVVLLLFLSAIALGSCTGAAGGSGAEEGEGTIALSLASVTSSRAARAAGEWSTATGTFAVSIESDGYYYSDSKTIQLSPGSPRSITFKSVPVGLSVTISATFTGTFDGITESKTYSCRVTKTIHSGHNVIALNLTESGEVDLTTTVYAVGNIVYSDGKMTTASNYDAYVAQSGASAIAVIFDAAGRKGLGLQQPSLQWCTADAYFCNNAVPGSSTSDGSVNQQIVTSHSDYSDAKYPAFAFAKNYSAGGLSGWYVPASGELQTLYDVKVAVNDALSLIPGAAAVSVSVGAPLVFYMASSDYVESPSRNYAGGFDASGYQGTSFIKTTALEFRVVCKF